VDDLAHARDQGLLPHDSSIVMDIVRFHYHARVQEMIEIRGWEWKILPPYSPYLNPVEYFFSQWKHHVKVSAPNNEEEIELAISQILSVVSPVLQLCKSRVPQLF